jgi:hypothetical protein
VFKFYFLFSKQKNTTKQGRNKLNREETMGLLKERKSFSVLWLLSKVKDHFPEFFFSFPSTDQIHIERQGESVPFQFKQTQECKGASFSSLVFLLSTETHREWKEEYLFSIFGL